LALSQGDGVVVVIVSEHVDLGLHQYSEENRTDEQALSYVGTGDVVGNKINDMPGTDGTRNFGLAAIC
jgi:hypothetical protein